MRLPRKANFLRKPLLSHEPAGFRPLQHITKKGGYLSMAEESLPEPSRDYFMRNLFMKSRKVCHKDISKAKRGIIWL